MNVGIITINLDKFLPYLMIFLIGWFTSKIWNNTFPLPKGRGIQGRY